ncbi:MAG: TetR/AcrR family transcriptional regulator [Saprospiraceae bacterium]|nr:TetR/AcrR family transcriptional regulator [Saprospiraceae bacterium]
MVDTRRNILEKNYEAMHRHGFQGVRPDKVISELGITKGAFYHYFPSKLDLGYAVVDEIIGPRYTGLWRQLDHYQGHPVEGIVWCLEYIRSGTGEQGCLLGCPLNNLINEMAPLDEGFRTRLQAIMDVMHGAIARALQRAVDKGLLNRTIDPKSYAYFVLAAMEGSFSVGKSMQHKAAFDAALDELITTLRAL